jgi:hypothetical protein
MKPTLSILAFSIGVLLVSGPALKAAPVQVPPPTPILIENGFSDDVVVEAGAVADPSAGYALAITQTASAAQDTLTFFEQGLATQAAGGLPLTGQFTSGTDGTTIFQLEPATQLNSIVGATGYRLKLAVPQAFPTLYLLATSLNGASPVTVTVCFADGSSTQVSVIIPDSQDTSSIPALTGLGEVDSAADTFSGANTQSLFQIPVDLTGFTGLVTAVEIDAQVTANIEGDAPVETPTPNVFAISGSAASPGVAIAIGKYAGLVGGDETVGNHVSHAFAQLVVTKTGAASGSIVWHGTKYPFKGVLDTNGFFSTTIATKETTSLNVSLVGAADGSVRVALGDGSVRPTGYIHGPKFDGKNHFGPAGVYNGVIGGLGQPGLQPALTTIVNAPPQTAGWVQTKVGATGSLTMVGTLPDGTAFSAGGFVDKEDSFSYYAALYTAAAKGSIYGTGGFEENFAMVAGGHWTRPAYPKTKVYSAGFVTDVEFLAAAYRLPDAFENAFGFNPRKDPTVSATLTGGDIGDDIDFSFAESINNVLGAVTPAEDGGAVPVNFTLKVTPKTGLFTGSFLNPATLKKTSFKGVISLAPFGATAVFLGPDQAGNLIIDVNSDGGPIPLE